jgi:23S rRNA pseudouridine1911/1915/1917 synthase
VSAREFPVPEGLVGERLDLALARLLGLSRSKAVEVIDAGGVRINGRVVGKSARLEPDSELTVDLAVIEPESLPAKAEPVPGLAVLYEDDEIIVVDKPAGVASHPSPGWTGPTVTGGLTAAGHHLSASGPAERQGVVHRLDVGTTGVMVLAKSDRAYTSLKAQFKERTVEKEYHAVVQGHLDPLEGTIDAPVGRHPGADYKFAVVRDGRPSVTHYSTLEAFPHASLVEVHLETGRTHQIRVHMSAMRHPCVGDMTYGADPVLAKRVGLDRQWLHAHRLEFTHPGSGERVAFTSEYPEDLATALARLRPVEVEQT